MSADDQHRVSRRRFLQSLGLAGVVGASGSLLAACGGGDGSGSSSGGGQADASPVSGNTVTLHPKGNQMKYEETEFTVPPGQEIELVFENTATSPAMQHNVVILNEPPSTQIFQEIGQAGTSAGAENEYVPSGSDAILAYTPMSKPGETVSVTFTTPEETGDYGYVCTYPGHWSQMQGTMHVKSSAA
jgi:azurin